MRIHCLGVALVALLLCGEVDATDRHVPLDHPTISAAIAASIAGDEVLVAPGTYIETIDFGGKAIIVRSTDGPEVTTIQGPGGVPVVRFDSGETAASVIEGFTITLGLGLDICGINGCETYGGGVHILDASPTVLGNIITGNTSTGAGVTAGMGTGAGIYVQGGAATIRFNLIVDNTAEASGGGMTIVDASALVENNTIVGNTASAGAAMWASGGAPTVLHNIFWGNSSPTPISGAGPITGTIAYCLVQGGFPGTGIIDADPLFVDAGIGDYHLGVGSPCIDAGDPLAPLEGDGTIVDLGAYSTGAVGTFFQRGDCNADALVNIADAIFHLNSLFPAPGSPMTPPECPSSCDANDDGSLNIADAVALLASLFGGGGALPEPSAGCGPDPTEDALECPSFAGCP